MAFGPGSASTVIRACILACLLLWSGRNAYSASVRLSVEKESVCVGDDLRVRVTVANNTDKPRRVGYARVPGDADRWARFHKIGSRLVKDGKIEVPRVPVRYKKGVIYSPAYKMLKPKEEFSFSVDVRNMYSLPVPESGKYKLTLNGARIAFEIKPPKRAVCTANAGDDLAWHRCLDYAVVPTDKNGEWLLLGRARNGSFYAGTYLDFEPGFMSCARVKMRHSDRSINGVLVVLGTRERIYYIDPRMTHYDTRMDRDVRKFRYKRKIPSSKIAGGRNVKAIEVFPNEFKDTVDYRITVSTAGKDAVVFLRQVKDKMTPIDAAAFRIGQEQLRKARERAGEIRKRKEQEKADAFSRDRERMLAEATPSSAELKARAQRALLEERARRQRRIRETSAKELLAEALAAHKKEHLEEALQKCRKLTSEYSDTGAAQEARKLQKETEIDILLREKARKTAGQIALARLKRALKRIGRDDGKLVEVIVARLEHGVASREDREAAQRLLAAAVPLALQRMNSSNPQVRLSAAIALGHAKSTAKKSVAALAKALKDKDVWVRIAAAKALGNLGQGAKDAIPSLREASKDKDTHVRQAAQDALEKAVRTGEGS